MNSTFSSFKSVNGRQMRHLTATAMLAAFTVFNAAAQAPRDTVMTTDGVVPAGNYHDVTVNPGINATVSGVVNVTGTFRVKSNGVLSVADAAYVSGNLFVMEDDAALMLETQVGVDGTTSGPVRTVNKSLGDKGRFTFNNSTQAQVTGPNFPDEVSELVINNPSGLGVSLSRPLGVRERLYLRNGELRTNGNKLTLISRAPDTAQVTAASCVVFQQSGTIVGEVTTQRYINPRYNAGVGYRHFSSSVSGNTVADFSSPANFDAVINPQYNTTPYADRFMPGAVTPYPNTFYYDEAQVGTGGAGSFDYVFNQGYLSPSATTDPIVRTRGYTVRIPASATMEFTGTLNNGDISATGLTRGPLNESGWHLVGNPYASKIDWTLLVRTNLMNSFYEYRSNGVTSGVYDSYVNGVATSGDGDPRSGVNQYIAANQAFFVRVSAPGATGQLDFSNAARITEFRNDPTAPFFRPGTTSSTNPLLRLRLRDANSIASECVVYFPQGATTGVDVDYDAYYIGGGHPVGIYSQVGTESLSIDGLPALTNTTDYTVALVANGMAAGTYTINAAELLDMPAGFQVLLQDAVTGTTQDLTQNPTYTYTSTGNNANATRFTVRFRSSGVTGISESLTASTFDVYPNPVKASDRLSISLPGVEQGKLVTATLVNQLGQRVWSGSFRSALGGVRQEVKADLAKGVYTMQIALPDGSKPTRRVVVQ
jgi:trimeric autotransporter adhesin